MKNICLIVVAVSLALSACTATPEYLEEEFIVSLEDIEPMLTHYEYSDWVTVEISGTGNVHTNLKSDALHVFRIGSNEYVSNPDIPIWGIIVDDYVLCCEVYQHPPFATSSWAYNPEHFYAFQYYVSGNPRQIQFISGDQSVDDNGGQFTVRVSTRPLFSGR